MVQEFTEWEPKLYSSMIPKDAWLVIYMFVAVFFIWFMEVMYNNSMHQRDMTVSDDDLVFSYRPQREMDFGNCSQGHNNSDRYRTDSYSAPVMIMVNPPGHLQFNHPLYQHPYSISETSNRKTPTDFHHTKQPPHIRNSNYTYEYLTERQRISDSVRTPLNRYGSRPSGNSRTARTFGNDFLLPKASPSTSQNNNISKTCRNPAISELLETENVSELSGNKFPRPTSLDLSLNRLITYKQSFSRPFTAYKTDFSAQPFTGSVNSNLSRPMKKSEELPTPMNIKSGLSRPGCETSHNKTSGKPGKQFDVRPMTACLSSSSFNFGNTTSVSQRVQPKKSVYGIQEYY